MTGRKLATQYREEDRETFFNQLSLYASLGNGTFLQVLLNYWIDQSIKQAPMKRRVLGLSSSWTMQNIQDSLLGKDLLSESSNTANAISPFIPLPSAKRRSALSTNEEEVTHERELKEHYELVTWSRRLYSLLEQRQAPIIKQIDSCLNPGRAVVELAGSTRPRTLKSYIGHWYRFTDFLSRVKSKQWPEDVGDYIDYIHMLVDEPCGASVPEAFLMAARFIEMKSGLAESEKFSSAPLVKAVVQRAAEKLRGPEGPTRRAPRIPAVVIEALEGLVMDFSAGKYVRGVAWLRLVKVWAAMRFSCHNYLSPSRLSLHEGELYGTLKKTKTTGPSRRVRELPIHICRNAYIKYGSWLQTGFELWLTLAPFERDYFLPLAAPDGNNTLRKMSSYAEAAAVGLEVLAALKLPNSNIKLLDPNWCAFFTEHSERSTMVTALVMLQASKDERDLVGRWKPEGSDVYVRTYHGIISRLQTQVAGAMRSMSRFETLQEKEIAQSFKVWSQERLQLTVEEADLQASLFSQVLKTAPNITIEVDDENPPVAVPASPLHLELEEGVNTDSSEEACHDDWFRSKNRPTNLYLIVKNNKGKGRLHKSDGCWIARYRALRHRSICSQEPDPKEYDFRCRLCWPSGLPMEDRSSEESSKGEDSPREQALCEEFPREESSEWTMAATLAPS